MNAAKNLLLALIVSLTGMTAGAKDLFKLVSKNTSQDVVQRGKEDSSSIKGHGGTCET
jgi:hypothetical protein